MIAHADRGAVVERVRRTVAVLQVGEDRCDVLHVRVVQHPDVGEHQEHHDGTAREDAAPSGGGGLHSADLTGPGLRSS